MRMNICITRGASRLRIRLCFLRRCMKEMNQILDFMLDIVVIEIGYRGG